MSIDGFEPLDEEERLLAAKLGMGKRSYAPSAAVDAAIRATAQKELARTATRKPTATAWWKVGGVAAACVLAMGIAWKTLHAPSTGELEAMQTAETVNDSPAVPAPAGGTAAEAASIPDEKPESDAVAENAAAQSEEATPAPAAATPPAPPALRTMADAPTATSAAPEHPATAAQADNSEPAIAADTESAGARLKQRAPVPLPPPEEVNAAQRANEAALEAPAPTPVPVPVTSSATRAAVHASPEAAAAPPASVDRSAAGALENGYDPRPPKTAGAEDVQLAWLKRIRALYQSGKKEEAAASLEAWRKRYPDAPVPADLAPLGKVTPEK